MAALLLAASVALAGLVQAAPADRQCRTMRTTGYVRSEYGPYTYDGTPIWSPEPLAAASWDVPMGSYVEVDGLGVYRVADRGMLGSSGWIDIAVDSRAQAYAITGTRTVCVMTPDEVGAWAP